MPRKPTTSGVTVLGSAAGRRLRLMGRTLLAKRRPSVRDRRGRPPAKLVCCKALESGGMPLMMERQSISRSGGIGRRARLRAWFPLVGVQVQVLSPAVTQERVYVDEA